MPRLVSIYPSRFYQLRAAYEAFDRRCPEVWDEFCTYTEDRYDCGWKHYSAMDIIGAIRWSTNANEEYVDVGGWKINQNFAAFYARRYMRTHLPMRGFFKTKFQHSMRTEPNMKRGTIYWISDDEWKNLFRKTWMFERTAQRIPAGAPLWADRKPEVFRAGQEF